MYDNVILMVLHLQCSVLNILTMTKISESKKKKKWINNFLRINAVRFRCVTINLLITIV